MHLNPKYLIYHDLIGIQAQILPKSKKSGKQFKDIGEIIDESQNMVIAKSASQVKKYIKKDHVFKFKISDKQTLQVDGIKIVGRPENRLRSLRKKR